MAAIVNIGQRSLIDFTLTDLMGGTSTCCMPFLACNSALILAAATAVRVSVSFFVWKAMLDSHLPQLQDRVALNSSHHPRDFANLWQRDFGYGGSPSGVMRATLNVCRILKVFEARAQFDRNETAWVWARRPTCSYPS